MKRPRNYSPYAIEAARLLGEQIAIARRERRWSQKDLAERADITPPTLAKVERGDPGVALGTAFELASLVGVTLFPPPRPDLDRTQARAALLPARVRARKGDLNDDF